MNAARAEASPKVVSRAFLKSVALDSIKVSERSRKDIGDLAGLKKSIETVGLLHPVVVTEDMRLIAGERRLAATASWATRRSQRT